MKLGPILRRNWFSQKLVKHNLKNQLVKHNLKNQWTEIQKAATLRGVCYQPKHISDG